MAVIENIKIEGDASQLIDAIEQLNNRVGELEGQLKDVNSGVKDLGKTGKTVSKAVGGIGTALKGIGIGIFIAAFDQLKEVFTGNQKVMDIFNTLLNTLKILFNDLAEAVLPPVSNLLNSIFSDPVQSIKDFGGAIKDYVLNYFDQVFSALGHLGKAFTSFFSGEFTQALDEVKLAGADMVDAIVGVEEGGIELVKNVAKTAFDYVKELPNKIKEAVNSAQALVELEKAAQLAAVQRQKIQLEYQRSAEKLRQLRDDETKSIDERIKANADLLALLEEQTEKEREQIAIQVAFARAEYEKNKTTENLVALRQAELELIDLAERLEGQRSEGLSNQNSLMREKLDITKSVSETDQEAFEIRAQAQIDSIRNELTRAEKEIEIAQMIYDRKKALLESEVSIHKEGTAARQEAENALKLFEEESYANKVKLEQNLRDVRSAGLQQSLDLTTQSLNAFADLYSALSAGNEKDAERAFKVNKALQLANAIASTAAAVTAQLAVPQDALTGANFVKAGIALTTGLAQVATISKTKFEPNGESTGNLQSSVPSVPSASPSFNVVGQSGINQLAQSISQQNKQPMRAYVVGSDVTSSQELERKRVKTATFG